MPMNVGGIGDVVLGVVTTDEVPGNVVVDGSDVDGVAMEGAVAIGAWESGRSICALATVERSAAGVGVCSARSLEENGRNAACIEDQRDFFVVVDAAGDEFEAGGCVVEVSCGFVVEPVSASGDVSGGAVVS